MYLNETDADNDDTASAAFNIDGMVLQVTPTGDASNITLRDVTIEQQDDYDRSPLFIDGTDFTAGAGPHVITVPTEWTPTNADMRFYRLDNSGIVTSLTPSSTSSTTFTLAETLLSTDVIFIGDDEFRELRRRATSTTQLGMVEQATSAEMTAGTSDKFPDASGIQGYYGVIESFTLTGGAANSGSLTGGSAEAYRVGRVVTIVGSFTFSASASAQSSASFLPASMRPTTTLYNSYFASTVTTRMITVDSSGFIKLQFQDYTGAGAALSSSGRFTITYLVD
jgi:hypothetical protein